MYWQSVRTALDTLCVPQIMLMHIFTPGLYFQCVFNDFQCVIRLLRALSVALMSMQIFYKTVVLRELTSNTAPWFPVGPNPATVTVFACLQNLDVKLIMIGQLPGGSHSSYSSSNHNDVLHVWQDRGTAGFLWIPLGIVWLVSSIFIGYDYMVAG